MDNATLFPSATGSNPPDIPEALSNLDSLIGITEKMITELENKVNPAYVPQPKLNEKMVDRDKIEPRFSEVSQAVRGIYSRLADINTRIGDLLHGIQL